MKQPVYSMTGYATMRVDGNEDASFTITLKSVNHRFLDLQMRLPQNCDTLETAIRKVLKDYIRRGHVEFCLQIDRRPRGGISVNHEQIAAYIATFRAAALAHNLSAEPDLNEVLRIPGMIAKQQSSSGEGTAELEAAVLAELSGLVTKFNAARSSEGAALAQELRSSARRIDALAVEAMVLRAGARAANFDRLRTRIEELTQGVTLSDHRLLAEAALLAERSDVEEELVRLRTHAAAFEGLLEEGGPLGKQLDFLLQELNREANTLLSKTGGAASQNGLRITELGLEIKLEIERAREQIQNLE